MKRISDQKLIALKCMSYNTDSEAPRDAIINEICLLQKLKSDKIIGVENIYEDKEMRMFWIELEIMEGDLLQGFIDWAEDIGGYSENVCKYILHEVLSGIDFAHERNIMHRDIRGMNMLFNKEGQVKLGDLGCAV